MAYFTFIHDVESAENRRDEDLEFMWSEKDNQLFDEEVCRIWERCSAKITTAVKNIEKQLMSSPVRLTEMNLSFYDSECSTRQRDIYNHGICSGSQKRVRDTKDSHGLTTFPFRGSKGNPFFVSHDHAWLSDPRPDQIARRNQVLHLCLGLTSCYSLHNIIYRDGGNDNKWTQ